ncbi:unnamed protein product, partial [Porites evermanni]
MAKNISSSEINNAICSSLIFPPGIHELKPEQILVIRNVVRGKDVLAALPTGFGKSLTFQILPSVLKSLQSSYVSPSPLVIVVCPLKSTLKTKSLGSKAGYVGESDELDKGIINGTAQINLLYGSPESFVGEEKIRGMFSNMFYRKNLQHPGERGNGKKDPFRKWCGAVGEIRSLLPQGLPMLALTATASVGTRNKVIEMLSLNKSVQIVVMNELEQKQLDCPKVLVYVRDYQRCSEIYHLFMQSLGAKAYFPPCANKTPKNRMVAMYHSGTSPSIQEIVLASLKDPNGKVRIIIATSALGMGVDIKGLHRIINYGPPTGRDGNQSEALLMFHGRQLHHCTPEMLESLKSTSCRRSKLLELFDKSTAGNQSFSRITHLCCDVCALECTCESINCPDINDSMDSLKRKSTDITASQRLRPVSIDQKNSLKEFLRECQKRIRDELMESNLKLFYANIVNVTCFTNELIENVVSKCDSLFSVEDILEKL